MKTSGFKPTVSEAIAEEELLDATEVRSFRPGAARANYLAMDSGSVVCIQSFAGECQQPSGQTCKLSFV